MIRIKHILSIIFSCYALLSFSQEGEYVTVRDLESWSSFNFQYKVNEKWKFNLEQQFRFQNNSSSIDAYITELSTEFDMGKYLYGGLGFRYISQMDDQGNVQGLENHLRFHFDLGAKHDIKRFQMNYRLRYQTKNELGVSKDEGDYANKHLRLKVGVEYNIKNWKLDPEFSSEIFTHFQKKEINGFDKFRITIGTKYKTKSIGKFGIFYRMERELNTPYPQTTNIIGFKYTYTFKNKIK